MNDEFYVNVVEVPTNVCGRCIEGLFEIACIAVGDCLSLAMAVVLFAFTMRVGPIPLVDQ